MELQRRDFLKTGRCDDVATAIPGCGIKQPKSLIPYVIPEENITPGKSVWYASVCQECPAGCGISVRVREGRAVKVEGIHSIQSTRVDWCARGQASLQGLYNPDRIQHPMKKRGDGNWETISWEEAEKVLADELLKIQKAGRGAMLSHVRSHQRSDRRTCFAMACRCRFQESIPLRTVRPRIAERANALTFGGRSCSFVQFCRCRRGYFFGADFLETWISPVEFTKGFTEHRGCSKSKHGTFFFVGPRLSLSATNADEWFAVNPGTEGILALGWLRLSSTRKLRKGSHLPRRRVFRPS